MFIPYTPDSILQKMYTEEVKRAELPIKIVEKDLESAIFLIQQSVVADPKNAKAWAIAGKIYLLSEDLPSAERFYKKAKVLGPLLKDVKDLESLINNKKKEE